MIKQLKPDIIATIKSDNDLNCIVAKIIGVAPASMPRILGSNDIRLTAKSVLEAISNQTKMKEAELLEFRKEEEPATR